jgi:hypothetical protein
MDKRTAEELTHLQGMSRMELLARNLVDAMQRMDPIWMGSVMQEVQGMASQEKLVIVRRAGAMMANLKVMNGITF